MAAGHDDLGIAPRDGAGDGRNVRGDLLVAQSGLLLLQRAAVQVHDPLQQRRS